MLVGADPAAAKLTLRSRPKGPGNPLRSPASCCASQTCGALSRRSPRALAQAGCVPRGDTLHIADRSIRLEELPGWSERPLLDHIAIRVGSIDAIAAHVRERGLDVSGPSPGGARTVILPGAERIRLDFMARTRLSPQSP